MKLILVDPDIRLCRAWEQAFQAAPDASAEQPAGDPAGHSAAVRHGILQDVAEADALVTAGNSFGLMDGGVDRVVAEMLPGVEQQVQAMIREEHFGELLVGQSLFIPGFRLGVIYAPTMRVPMSIVGSDAVYRAMWSALGTARQAGVSVLAVPGLGTGAGCMPPAEAARQMALAWRNHLSVPLRTTWRQARARHQEIVDGGMTGG